MMLPLIYVCVGGWGIWQFYVMDAVLHGVLVFTMFGPLWGEPTGQHWFPLTNGQ